MGFRDELPTTRHADNNGNLRGEDDKYDMGHVHDTPSLQLNDPQENRLKGRQNNGTAEQKTQQRTQHTTSPRTARWTPYLRYWRAWRFALSVIILATVLAWTVAPNVFAPGDPLTGVIMHRLQPPSAAHWFGTDQLGRDLYTRVVHGTALSMEATVVALALAFVVSTVIGVTAGYLGGRIDEGFMRVVDVLLSIPSLLVSLMLISALGFGTLNIALAVGIASIASFARVTRSQVLKVCVAPYIEAARAYGSPWYVICIRHIYPHARGPVLSLLSIEFGAAILSISALSFLGYGATPPTPEWGNLVADGRSYLASAWWLTTLPGLVIVATVLSVNGLGRGFRQASGGGR